MCGIAGIVQLDGRPVTDRAIDRFTDAVSHRGPDGRGTWIGEGGVGLGHRRLAILDVSEGGKQPMTYGDGRLWITFNGEIYNFVEIRDTLEGKGYRFRSSSDTEVILAAYLEWGDGMLQKFNGMWAFAIWDTKERTLFLARDRFGIKPLHYLLTDKLCAFASELKAFGSLVGFQVALDTESLGVAFHDPFNLEGSTRTLIRGVRRLQGGHSAFLRDGKFTVTRWWNTLNHLKPVSPSLHGQAKEFADLFQDAVRLRMRSDVPVGTCLSGGFDSTAVACTMGRIGRESAESRQAQDWRHAFVASFPGMANDETSEAREAASFAGVQSHFLDINKADATEDIDAILMAQEDLYVSLPSAVWLLYRELRNHNVVVSLDGHGADELMGGYRGADFGLLGEAPPWLLSPLQNVRLLRSLCDPKLNPHAGFLRRTLSAVRSELTYHPDFEPLRSLRRRLRRSSRTFTGGAGDFARVGEQDELPASWGSMNRSLYFMFHSTILPTILRNFDRMSMAHGIEVRMPFMDWRLVTFVMSLPETSKLANGVSKLVAREALRGLMPESIRTSRKKVGFNSPMPEWLGGPLRPWVEALIHDFSLTGFGLVDLPKFRAEFRSTTERGAWSWGNTAPAWKTIHLLWLEKSFLRRLG